MRSSTRREFLRRAVPATAMVAVAAGVLPSLEAAEPATQVVPLGQSGLKVSRLAFGTGTRGGAVQAALGQREFTRQVRYAYDHGIRFFETAEAYQTPAMLGEALKGLPRESYVLLSKVTTDYGADPRQRFDAMRRESRTEYFDVMLLHWQHTADWVSETRRWQDGIEEAQQRKLILKRGASVHGLPALRQMPGNRWLDVALVRINHDGAMMDGPTYRDGRYPADIPEVVGHVQQVRAQGTGVIGMKLVGAGQFTRREDRQKAMRFALRQAGADAVTVGFTSTAEIDEAMENMRLAMA